MVLSRDDSVKFLPDYIDKGIFPEDPFVSLDKDGVGFLVKYAAVEGIKSNPRLHIGVYVESMEEILSLLNFVQI